MKDEDDEEDDALQDVVLCELVDPSEDEGEFSDSFQGDIISSLLQEVTSAHFIIMYISEHIGNSELYKADCNNIILHV